MRKKLVMLSVPLLALALLTAVFVLPTAAQQEQPTAERAVVEEAELEAPAAPEAGIEYVPPGWAVVDNAGNGGMWNTNDTFGVVNRITYGGTGASGLSMAAEADGSGIAWDTEIWTPPIDLTGATTATVEFESNFQDFAGNGDAYLDVSTDGGGSWTNIHTQSSDDPIGGELETFSLDAYVSNTVHLRFRYTCSSGTTWYWHIDNVHVYDASITYLYEDFEPPPAPDFDDSFKLAPPIALVGDFFTYTLFITNSGDLAATAVSIDDALPAEVTQAGPATYATLGAGVVVTNFNDTDPIAWFGSIPPAAGLVMTVPVQAAAAGNIVNTATITDPDMLSLVTLDAPTNLIVPLNGLWEDFEHGGALPPNWINDPNDGGEDWLFDTSATYGAVADHTTGSGYLAWIDDSIPENAVPANLVSPPVDLSGFNLPALKFWLWNRRTSGADISQLAIDIHDGTMWHNDVFTVGHELLEWTPFYVDLSPYLGNIIQVRFRGNESSDFTSDLSLDDVSIEDAGPAFGDSWKDVNSRVIGAADPLTYTLYITNSGLLSSTDGSMVDHLPAGLLVDSASLDGGGALDVGLDTITWTTSLANPLLAGETATITLVATGTAGLPCGISFTNTTFITDSQASNPAYLASPQTTIAYFPPAMFESFETGGTIPLGWINDPNDGGEDWLFDIPGEDANPAQYGAYYDHTTGDGYIAWIDDSSPNGAVPANLVSPPIDLSGLSSPELGFWLWNTNPDNTGNDISVLHVDISLTNWITDIAVIDQELTSWTNFRVSLAPYAGNTIQVRFRAMETTSFYSDISLDDVSIAEPWSPCPVVTIGPDQAQVTCPGNTLDYMLTLRNNTPATDTFNLNLIGATWPTVVNPNALTLDPGESGLVTVTVDVPEDAMAGDYDAISVVAQGNVLADAAEIQSYAQLGSGWEDLAASPHGARYQAVVYDDGYLYQIGGNDDGGYYSGTFRLDIAGNTWMTMTDMITPVYEMDGAAINGYIYIPGGQASGSTHNAFVQVYSTTADAWSTVAPMPVPVRYHEVVAMDGKLYVLGGQTTGSVYTNTVQIYDPSTDSWSMGAPMTIPVGYAASGAITGSIYLAGGYNGDYQFALQIYDPTTDSWSMGAPMPTNWVRAADGVLHDRYLILAGGYQSSLATASVYAWFYDVVNDAWVFLPNANSSRYGAEGAGDGNDFYYQGGREYDGTWFYSGRTEHLLECQTTYPQVSIYDIQFVPDPVADDASPWLGQMVWTEGIVIADSDTFGSSNTRYYIEDALGGPWSGLYIYNGGDHPPVAEGDHVQLVGLVEEYNGVTELNIRNSEGGMQTIVSSGNPLPAPEILATSVFTPTGTATAEAYESVLIEFQAATVVSDDLGFGEWAFDDGSGETHADDWSNDLTYIPAMDDYYAYIRGVGNYSFGEYKLVPRYDPDISVLSPTLQLNPTSFDVALDPAEVATYTLSLSNTGGMLYWSLAENPAVTWLDESPTSGSLMPMEGTDVELVFDAPMAGVYTTNLEIYSNDPSAPTVTVPVILTVNNLPPVAVSDAYTTGVDTPLMVGAPGLLANDSDPNEDSLSAVLDGDPANGTLNLAANGSFVYTPTTGYVGTDAFTYHANDGMVDSNIVTVSLNVTEEVECIEVSGVDLTIETTGPIYVDDVVDFASDIMPDDATKPYTYTIDYGDGMTMGPAMSSDDPMAFTHAYTQAGSYTLEFWAWNCDMTVPVTDSVEVMVMEPVTECVEVSGVDLTLETTGTIYVDDVVDFSGDVMPDDATKPYTYVVAYGDGMSMGPAMSSDDPMAFTHAYTQAGSYTAEFWAWNCDMTVPMTDSVEVMVMEMVTECVEVTGVDLTQITTGTIYAGDTVDFSADITPDDATKPYTYALYLDGTAVMPAGSSSDDPYTFDHTFEAAGSYTLEFWAWNCDMTVPFTDTVEVTVMPAEEGYTVYMPIVIKND